MPFLISPHDLEAVKDAHDLDTLKERTQRIVEQLGFEGFMYIMLWREDTLADDPKTVFLGTYDPEHMKTYQENQWLRIDPASQHILKHHLPLAWRKADFASPESRTVLDAALRHGVGAGAIFPVMSSNASIAGMGIARDADPDTEYERTLQMLPFGQLLAMYVHAAVSSILKHLMPPAIKDLSQRERECLQLAARGMRDAEIARTLNITTRTVISHLNSARDKLQADNRAQMIAKAMALKIIGL